jgi:Cu/Ag efflux protein CusF
MRTAKIILASGAALNMFMSAALAQQTIAGMVTKVDRVHGTIAIQQTQSGTVGANTGGAAEEFKVQDGLLLNALHAGDKVTFSAAENGGVKSITKLQGQ